MKIINFSEPKFIKEEAKPWGFELTINGLYIYKGSAKILHIGTGETQQYGFPIFSLCLCTMPIAVLYNLAFLGKEFYLPRIRKLDHYVYQKEGAKAEINTLYKNQIVTIKLDFIKGKLYEVGGNQVDFKGWIAGEPGQFGSDYFDALSKPIPYQDIDKVKEIVGELLRR